MNPKRKQLLKILKILQSNFPINKNPYRTLAARLGMDEASLISKIKAFKKNGMIRRIGAVVSSRHLGYRSVLIALEVPRSRISRVVQFINSQESVTHNYQRNSRYNIWFTFSAKTKKETDVFLGLLKKKEEINKILVLPAEKVFKINAEFNF